MTNENLIDALKEKISSLEEWYARERTACMKQFKQVEALTADVNELRAKLSTNLVEWQKRFDAAFNAREAAEAEIARIAADRDEWKARAEAAEERARILEAAELEALKRAEAAETAERDQCQAAEEWEHLCRKAESDLATLRAAVALSQQAGEELRAENERLEKQWEEHCAFHGAESPHALNAALYRASDAESHCKALSEDVFRLSAENERLREERDVYDDQAREVCRTLDRVIEERGDWYQRAEAAESHCKALAEDRSALRAENERLREEKREQGWVQAQAAESRLAELEKELERLRALLVSDPIESARQYFERAKAAESRCAELEKEVETLRSIDNKASENG